MAVNDHSIGPFYLASMRVPVRFGRPAKVGVVEECEPWRRGRAVMFPFFWKRALLIGWWRVHKPNEYIDAAFDDVQWLDPKQVFVQPDVIATWDDGRGDNEVAQEEAPDS